MSSSLSSTSASSLATPLVTCIFCEKRQLEEDPATRLVPLSLRHRAFAHGPCTRKYCQRECEWCVVAPVAIGQRVLGVGLLWQGRPHTFPAEVVGEDAGAGTCTLCFADAAELQRVGSNPDWQSLAQRAEAQSNLQPRRAAAGRGPAGAAATQPAALPVDAAALYDYGLLLAFGLCGLPRDRPKAVELWRLAADLGHPSAVLGIAVPRITHVRGLCAFHGSPEVKAWWRLLPPRILVSSLDVRPEEVLDGVLGSTLADAAGAPNDPVDRAHAATDAVVGAFAALFRSMHTPSNVLAASSSPAVAVGAVGGGDATTQAVAATANDATDGGSSVSSGRSAGRGGGIDDEEVGVWHASLREHLQTFRRCFHDLPGAKRTRGQQLERIAELQKMLAAKQADLDESLIGAKSQLAEDRWKSRRLLKLARRADDASVRGSSGVGGGSGESEYRAGDRTGGGVVSNDHEQEEGA